MSRRGIQQEVSNTVIHVVFPAPTIPTYSGVFTLLILLLDATVVPPQFILSTYFIVYDVQGQLHVSPNYIIIFALAKFII